MRMPTVVDAVVFDCDGLLAETESALGEREALLAGLTAFQRELAAVHADRPVI